MSKHSNLINECNKLITDTNEILNCNISYLTNILVYHNIHKSWYDLFLTHSDKLVKTLKNIDEERKIKNIYPPHNLMFKVFEKNIDDIKIVLIGQDPYIRNGQAMGLSFSVPQNIIMPPSLYNIFTEIKNEFPERKYKFTHGDLTKWYNNGIFLLNSALTVIEGKSNSQQDLWSWFTDHVIEYINSKKHDIVFLLLGKNAISKQIYINKNINHIVTGVHPSPMSANNGFFNSGIFKNVEKYLNTNIDWSN